MDFSFSAEAGLAGLFLASFLSATLLPGGSEVVLIAVVHQNPDQVIAAFLLATLGNTIGGMTTYGMARLLPEKVAADGTAAKRLNALRRHGAPLLILAWTPIIGDALCAAAGWLRLPPAACTLWMAVGKATRYAAVVAGAGMI